jgi:D-lyxose ketol-isomerase
MRDFVLGILRIFIKILKLYIFFNNLTMKRSEINQLILSSIDFFDRMNFKLPPWAYWPPEVWKGKYGTLSEIVDNMLGWDFTDLGSGDFHRCELILFTIRKGNIKKDKKPYSEPGKGKVFVGEVSAVNDDCIHLFAAVISEQLIPMEECTQPMLNLPKSINKEFVKYCRSFVISTTKNMKMYLQRPIVLN